MMIYYAPTELYKLNATVMEMICASVCITSMICFTLEKTFRSHRLFDEEAHANPFRMAARGNATSFPLPWHDLLQQLHKNDDDASAQHRVVLPRTGEDLANVVSVLLKTCDAKDSDKDLARLVHQAIVRRDVVVQLILSMKNEVIEVIETCAWKMFKVERKHFQKMEFHQKLSNSYLLINC